MTPERIEELRRLANSGRPVNEAENEINECLDAIERLQAERQSTEQSYRHIEANELRYRAALEQVQSFCSDRQRVAMMGVMAFGRVERIVVEALAKEPG